MNDLTDAPGTDPTLLYRGRDELYAEDMLIAAVKGFDFFTVLAGLKAEAWSVDEIARHFGFHPRPVDVMTTHFVARGLLERYPTASTSPPPRANTWSHHPPGSSGRTFPSSPIGRSPST